MNNYENIFINGLIGTIYDSIGNVTQKGVELIDVIKQVQGAPFADGFNVYINSEGGVVETGFEIYDYLVKLGKPINTIGVGQVASIATVIFMAGETRKLKTGTELLIHLPMVGLDSMYNSQDLEAVRIELEQVEKRLIDFYKKSTGLTDEALLPLLKRETSLNPSDAFDLRFCTEYDVEFSKAVAYIQNKNNLNLDKPMTDNDKSWLQSIVDSAIAKVSGKKPDDTKKGFNVLALVKATEIVNLVDVTDANGVLITFPDVAEGTLPVEGDMATIDGKPAEGEYLMPDGSTMVFIAGALSQIVPANNEEMDVETLNAEIGTLKAEIETLKTTYTNTITDLKKQITNRFEKKEEKTPPKGGDNEEQPKKRQLLKQTT